MDKNKKQALANMAYNLFETLKQSREEMLLSQEVDNAEKIKQMIGVALGMYYEYTDGE